MGTHPIFESDFDCLTDFFQSFGWFFRNWAVQRKRDVSPQSRVHDDSFHPLFDRDVRLRALHV